jgi:hypothetical protein
MTITGGQRSDPVRIESIAKRHAWNDLITGLPDCALEQGFEWGEILKESGYEDAPRGPLIARESSHR